MIVNKALIFLPIQFLASLQPASACVQALEFAYTGELRVDPEGVLLLWPLAAALQVTLALCLAHRWSFLVIAL